MNNFIWLVFAHYFGDSALQSSFQAEKKATFWYVMFCHCIVWTACISIALQYLHLFAIWKVFFLLIGHWISDKWKSNIWIKFGGEKNRECSDLYIKPYLLIDQLWHFIQLGVVYAF
jgi:hypothetical protein